MVSTRTLAFVSSFCLLFGALLVGDGLHQTVVTSQLAVTSPAAVGRLLGGVAAIAIGARLRVPPEQRLGDDRTEPEPEPENESFDLDRSPFDETSMERLAERERDREEK